MADLTVARSPFSAFKPGMGALPLLEGLFERAEALMTDDELQALATDAPVSAENIATNLAATARGIASLVAGDNTIGALRDPEGASKLLFGLADQAEQVESLLRVAELARGRLAERSRVV